MMSPEECDRWVKRAHIKWESFREAKPVLSLRVEHNERSGALAFTLDTGAVRTIAPMSYLAQFYTEAELFRDTYKIDADEPSRPGDVNGERMGICLRGRKIQRLKLKDAQGGSFYGVELPVVLNIQLKDRILPIQELIAFSNEARSGLLGRSALRNLGVTFVGTGSSRYFGLFAAPGAQQEKPPVRTYVIGDP
jgi:hypothetical protein